MHQKHIFFLINPAAGNAEPISDKIAAYFTKSVYRVTTHVLKEHENPAAIVSQAVDNADMIAIYGGDGSVTTAAVALINTETPLAIIPGGTANVFAKELGIPQDIDAALKLIRDGEYHVKSIDTGTVNASPFLLRVNLGIMEEMITETDAELKEKVGQIAYAVATVKSLINADAVPYQLDIDGHLTTTEGVSLTVTNSGSAGIGNLQIQPGISIADGLLDVILLQDAGVLSIIKATGAALLSKQTNAVKHWAGKEITITCKETKRYLRDDCEDEAKKLEIKVVPASLKVVVPLNYKDDE